LSTNESKCSRRSPNKGPLKRLKERVTAVSTLDGDRASLARRQRRARWLICASDRRRVRRRRPRLAGACALRPRIAPRRRTKSPPPSFALFPLAAAASGVVAAVRTSRLWGACRAYRALVEDAFSAILWRFVGAVVNYTRRVVAFASSLYIRACGTRVKRDERPSESENAATLDRLADGVNHRQRRLRPSGARTQCDARYIVSVSFLLALSRECARARAWCVSVCFLRRVLCPVLLLSCEKVLALPTQRTLRFFSAHHKGHR